MLIVGEQEEKNGTVSVRKHGGEDLGSMSIAEFSEVLNQEIKSSVKEFEV